MSDLIFSPCRPEISYEKLKKKNKTWLIRESRVKGMITIDYIDDDGVGQSRRFAFNPNTRKWMPASSLEDLTTAKLNFLAITLYVTEIGSYITDLLNEIKTEFSFIANENVFLKPSEHEQTRTAFYADFNSLYSLLAVANSEKIVENSLKLICPISHKDPSELIEPAWLFDNLYEKEELVTWVSANGSCPKSRAPARLSDIKESSSVKRYFAKAAELGLFKSKRNEIDDEYPHKKLKGINS